MTSNWDPSANTSFWFTTCAEPAPPASSWRWQETDEQTAPTTGQAHRPRLADAVEVGRFPVRTRSRERMSSSSAQDRKHEFISSNIISPAAVEVRLDGPRRSGAGAKLAAIVASSPRGARTGHGHERRPAPTVHSSPADLDSRPARPDHGDDEDACDLQGVILGDLPARVAPAPAKGPRSGPRAGFPLMVLPAAHEAAPRSAARRSSGVRRIMSGPERHGGGGEDPSLCGPGFHGCALSKDRKVWRYAVFWGGGAGSTARAKATIVE